jgi:nicotinamidase-related amidase
VISTTALLLLDLQRDFMDLEGVYGRHGLPVERLRGIVPAVSRVAAACRARGVPVFASRFTVFTAPDGTPLGLDHIARARPFLAREGFRWGDPGRELIEELPPPDYVLDKPRFSAFYGTPLEVLLRSLGVTRLALAGIVTHGGVESTARDAMLRDLAVVVLEDCVAALDAELHRASLRSMALYLTVMGSPEFLDTLPC